MQPAVHWEKWTGQMVHQCYLSFSNAITYYVFSSASFGWGDKLLNKRCFHSRQAYHAVITVQCIYDLLTARVHKHAIVWPANLEALARTCEARKWPSHINDQFCMHTRAQLTVDNRYLTWQHSMTTIPHSNVQGPFFSDPCILFQRWKFKFANINSNLFHEWPDSTVGVARISLSLR